MQKLAIAEGNGQGYLQGKRVAQYFSETPLPFVQGQVFTGWNSSAYYGVFSIPGPFPLYSSSNLKSLQPPKQPLHTHTHFQVPPEQTVLTWTESQ